MTLKPLSQRFESPYMCPSCQRPMPDLHRYRRVLQKRRLDAVLRTSLLAHRTAAAPFLQELQALSRPGKTGGFPNRRRFCCHGRVLPRSISQMHVTSWHVSSADGSLIKLRRLPRHASTSISQLSSDICMASMYVHQPQLDSMQLSSLMLSLAWIHMDRHC